MIRKLLFTCMLALFTIGMTWAQDKQVTGQVTDELGEGIPGATIQVKGTTNGVSSDIDGNYSIKVESTSPVLIFSSIGYEVQEVVLGNKSTLNVVLKDDTKELDEVIVVAYGTADKKSFTGSASVVKSEDIVQVSGGIAKSLQGRVAGLQVVGGDVRIRGYGSFNANSSPLYVVDGIVGAPQPNIEDVESTTVLKDAASTALYGSRAANGVIIITTKKGKKGQKPKFTFKYQKGIVSAIEPDYKLMNAEQHYRYVWNAKKNTALKNDPTLSDAQASAEAYNSLGNAFNGHNPFNMNEPFNSDGSLKPDAKLLYSTDWRKEGIQNGQNDQVDFAVSGGTEKSQYYWSIGYFDQEGLVKNDTWERYSTDFNFNTELRDNIKVGFRSRLRYYETQDAYSGGGNENNLLYVSNVLTPVAPLHQLEKEVNPDGTWTYKTKKNVNGNPLYDWTNPNYQAYNPIGLMEMDWDKGYGFNSFFAPWIEVELIEDLKIKGTASARLNSSKSDYWQNSFFGSGATEPKGGGYSSKETEFSRKFTYQLLATYDFSINDMHKFSFLAGAEQEDYTRHRFDAASVGYPLGAISTELSTGAQPKGTPSSSTLEIGLASYLASMNYSFNDRYFLDASFRTDGSSRFGEDKRWGKFWATGVSWRISEEDFLSNTDWIDNLKLRASYGYTGTNAISDYLYADLYSTGSNYMGQTGIVHSNLPNPELRWERNKNFSVGVDFELFGTLRGTVEYYNKISDGLLLQKTLPVTTGFPYIWENIGEMKNSGFEVELTNQNISTSDFQWSTSFTISYNKNEITSLPYEQEINGSKINKVGGSLYDYYIREWAGVNPDNGAAQWWMDVEDAEGKVTKEKTEIYADATRYEVGRSTPDYVGALINDFNYKGFDLSVQLYYSIGGKIHDGAYNSLLHDGGDEVNLLTTDALNYWTTAGQNADHPKPLYSNSNQTNSLSTRQLVDGSFVKLKNVTFGYTVPKNVLNKIGLESARIFATADNLWIKSDLKSGDPELRLSGRGLDYSFPNTRTYRFGVSVNF